MGKGTNTRMQLFILELSSGSKVLLLPSNVAEYMGQEEPEYWENGDFSMLEMLFPEWAGYVRNEIQNQRGWA